MHTFKSVKDAIRHGLSTKKGDRMPGDEEIKLITKVMNGLAPNMPAGKVLRRSEIDWRFFGKKNF